MANDSLNSEEEYHFTETDAADALEASNPPEKKPPMVNKVLGSRVLLVLGIIILVLAIYKLAGVFFTSSHKTVVAPKTEASASHAVALPPQALVQTSVTPNALAKVTDRVEKLESALPQMTATLTELQSKVSDLNATLQALSNTLTQQQAQLTEIAQKQLRPPAPKPQALPKRPAVMKGQIYYVQAMVPGRAWLKGKESGTTTVKVGDTLPGYGIIEMIDTGQGRVLTSSGRVINYNPSDS